MPDDLSFLLREAQQRLAPGAFSARRQRGMSAENAISMIVHGFCKEVFKNLPMEFAVEAQKLISISLEGSVG